MDVFESVGLWLIDEKTFEIKIAPFLIDGKKS